MEMYELMPTDGRKSFYNKAVVKIDDSQLPRPSAVL